MAKTYVPDLGRRVFQRPSPKPNSSRPYLGTSSNRSKPREASSAARKGRTGFPGLLEEPMVDRRPQMLVAVGSVGSLRLPWIDVVSRTWSQERVEARGELTRCVPADWFIQKGIAFDPKRMNKAGHYALRRFVGGLSGSYDIVADGGTGAFSALAPYVELGQAYGYHIRCVLFVTEEHIVRERKPDVSQPLAARQVGRVKRVVETWPGFWPTPEVVVEETFSGVLREWGVY